jgi:hydrogenase maturation protein HypF
VIRLALRVEGVVQGVGFRPFVHGAATARGLAGWVRNRRDGVGVEVEGPGPAVEDFLAALRDAPPPAARVDRIRVRTLRPAGERGFRILASAGGAAVRPALPADLAVCAACTAETETPGARRHRYPFTNCTRCGPRWTLIEALPYDRRRTAMRRFTPCAACADEYADPADRRFHAEPIACPACGPTLALVGADGTERARGEAALTAATEALAAGTIVALHGVGGFHLLADATSAAAVTRLRARKRRPDKPFAVLFASPAAARAACILDPAEERALASPAAPILLVRRRAGADLAEAVAPGNPLVGALLPATPLHRLVALGAGRPLVCTSGNLSDEPIAIDPAEARARLGRVADLFLVHDRPVVRPVDDSVARVGPDGLQVLRRARGFAPLPVRIAEPSAPCVLALGAQQKSTIALVVGGQAVVSQHLGDLHHAAAALLLERTVADLLRLLDARPARIACDLHPDYASTRLAERLAAARGVPLERVQHHHAHVAAVVAEHGLRGPVLGLAWDGAGLGLDGVLWGGEALVVDGPRCRRAAHLRPFPLPGGERAMREPRRAALGLLSAIGAAEAVADLFSAEERRVLATALARRVNCPQTTAVGRLFDAVAALAGLGARASFEAQAAMALEFAAAGAGGGAGAYPFPLGAGAPAVADWEPLARAVLADRARGVPPAVIAARFHAALGDLALAIARRAGVRVVALTGGCFQNARLLAAVQTRLGADGFAVHVGRAFPPNDGGIALGQALIALRRGEER